MKYSNKKLRAIKSANTTIFLQKKYEWNSRIVLLANQRSVDKFAPDLVIFWRRKECKKKTPECQGQMTFQAKVFWTVVFACLNIAKIWCKMKISSILRSYSQSCRKEVMVLNIILMEKFSWNSHYCEWFVNENVNLWLLSSLSLDYPTKMFAILSLIFTITRRNKLRNRQIFKTARSGF